MATKILLRRDSAADWTTEEPILAEGEIGVELDTYTRFKLGNGSTSWSTLKYFAPIDDTSTGVSNTWSSAQIANSLPSSAVDLVYSNATSGLTATDVQAAIDEVDGLLDTKRTSISTQTVSYQLTGTDHKTIILCNHATGMTITVPAESTEDLLTGFTVDLVQYGAGQITVAGGVGVTVNTPDTLLSNGQWSTMTLTKIGTDEWILSGNIAI